MFWWPLKNWHSKVFCLPVRKHSCCGSTARCKQAFPYSCFIKWIGIWVFEGQILRKLFLKYKLHQSSTQIISVLLNECLLSELIHINCHSHQDVGLEKGYVCQEGLLGVNWAQIHSYSLAAIADRGLSYMLDFRKKLQTELSASCTVFLLSQLLHESSWHHLLISRIKTCSV